jgi:hypothetical protein
VVQGFGAFPPSLAEVLASFGVVPPERPGAAEADGPFGAFPPSLAGVLASFGVVPPERPAAAEADDPSGIGNCGPIYDVHLRFATSR